MRMVLVSNRLPVTLEREEGKLAVRPAAGGLVQALDPIMRRRGGLWVGWAGGIDAPADEIEVAAEQFHRNMGYELLPVVMSKEEVEGFYQGFCNEIIWPLFHDLQTRCNFVPDYWAQYQAVKNKFADVLEAVLRPGDFVWVQDYHLLGFARTLRERGLNPRLGFFLHIPFPPPDIFCKLPWREDVLKGLLQFDVIGLQTARDRENLLDCVRRLLPEARLRRREGSFYCRYEERSARIGMFPIGIDYERFARAAASPAIEQRVQALRRDMPNQQIILSVDRLDYTKGIPERLRAFQLALKRYPELRRTTTLIQVVVPSRENVPEYQDLKRQVEQTVTQVNGEFTEPGWVPTHHVFRSMDFEELVSYYRLADVALITPLKDGMNLVAKEYCASQVDGDGVLILSEFAGAAFQLGRGALLVNPYDLDQVAAAIRRAVSMPVQKRRTPMRRLRRIVQREDVFWWVDRFLTTCGVNGTPAAAVAAPRSQMESKAAACV